MLLSKSCHVNRELGPGFSKFGQELTASKIRKLERRYTFAAPESKRLPTSALSRLETVFLSNMTKSQQRRTRRLNRKLLEAPEHALGSAPPSLARGIQRPLNSSLGRHMLPGGACIVKVAADDDCLFHAFGYGLGWGLHAGPSVREPSCGLSQPTEWHSK